MFVITRVLDFCGTKYAGREFYVSVTDGDIVISFRPKEEKDPLGFYNMMSAEKKSGDRYYRLNNDIRRVDDGTIIHDADLIDILRSCEGKVPRYIPGSPLNTYFI